MAPLAWSIIEHLVTIPTSSSAGPTTCGSPGDLAQTTAGNGSDRDDSTTGARELQCDVARAIRGSAAPAGRHDLTEHRSGKVAAEGRAGQPRRAVSTASRTKSQRKH